MSKCVYLACMALKIEHTVGGHKHDILQQYISDVYANGSCQLLLEACSLNTG